MDYNTLIGGKTVAGSIANWMNDSRIPDVASEIITDAIGNISMRLRHWRMQSLPVPMTLTAGNSVLQLPDEFIEPAMIAYAGGDGDNYQLDMSTLEDLSRQFTYINGVQQSGMPTKYCIIGGAIQLNMPPDKDYSIIMSYYQQPPVLSATNPTNWLTKLYPRLVRTSLMISAAEWMKDSGQGNFDRTYWTVVFQDQLTSAQADSDRNKRALLVRPVVIR